MNVYKVMFCIGLALCLVGMLVPYTKPVTVYEQTSPGMQYTDSSPQEQDVVRVNPNRGVRQRLWIPGISITEVHFFVSSPSDKSLQEPLPVTLFADEQGVVGEKILEALAEITQMENHGEIVIRFDTPLPIAEQWVWVEVSVPSPSPPLYFYRDIDSQAYPESKLLLMPVNKVMHGVLAFRLVSPQSFWVQPRYGIFILAGLLLGWIWIFPIEQKK